MTTPIPPVQRSIKVSWTQQEAFTRFTEKFGEWWPHRSHSIGAKRVKRIVLEPKLGGLIYEEHVDGRRFLWGKITEWSPPRGLAFTFHPSMEQEKAQDVRIVFTTDANATTLTLQSTGWEKLGPQARRARGGYQAGWGYILSLYAGRRTTTMVMLDAIMSVTLTMRRLSGKNQLDEIAKAKGEIL